MTKRHVLQLITSLERGGAERMLVDLLVALDRTRFDVTVATLLATRGALAREVEELGVTLTNLGLRHSRDIRSLVRAYSFPWTRFDVVHAHLPGAGMIARGARLLRRVPLVYTEQNVPSGYSRRGRLANAATLRFCDEFVAVSEQVLRAWTPWTGRTPSQVIYSGISCPLEQIDGAINRQGIRAELGIASDQIVIGNVANLYARKGQRWLLEAFAPLTRNYDVILLIVGGGPLREDLESEALRLGIANRVRLLGVRHDVPRLLGALDVFVLSSLAEGMPLALLEAMGHALPCIVTRVGGNPEAVRHGVTGLVVEPADALGLRHALVQVVDSADQRTRFGTAGHDRIHELFTADRMARAYQEIYDRLMRD